MIKAYIQRMRPDVNSDLNMAALLDSYEQQYGIISASITAKTAKLSGTALGIFHFSFPEIFLSRTLFFY